VFNQRPRSPDAALIPSMVIAQLELHLHGPYATITSSTLQMYVFQNFLKPFMSMFHQKAKVCRKPKLFKHFQVLSTFSRCISTIFYHSMSSPHTSGIT